ncbi:hypothetical protein [Arthrobacter roseus]|uniref:hypothetical protein n=1 Tax=Arthrobacter roseus TaxID=136274 RepID=UPI001963CD52|nr:hypothetical protein [Arthrobacter roseus]MBM7846925.1 hypothetical protein [Arthrobacter roseus]
MRALENPIVPTFGEALGSFGPMVLLLSVGLFAIYRLIVKVAGKGKSVRVSRTKSLPHKG